MEINNLNSLVELFFEKTKTINPSKPFLQWLKPNKPIYTWSDISEKVYKLTNEIKSLIVEGDRCIILSENRPNWLISDLAIMNAGGISVPIFTTYSLKDYEFIFDDCKPKLIIISNNEQYKKIKNFINEDNQKIISFEKIDIPTILTNDIFKKNNHNETINKNLRRNSPACIIYTSGTSGTPKGVILSHGGILSNCEGALGLLKPLIKKKDPIFLTWLPLSHSYEHTVQFIQIILGARVFYAESLEKLLSNMSIAKPTIMTAVPRFYQNLFNKINSNIKKQSGFKKYLINKTIFLGKKILRKKKLKYSEKLINFFCDILVRKKIHKQFGGNLQTFVSGGGALDINVGEFLNAIGLPTLQGYGLTETSPVVSCNIPGSIKVETVGPPFKTNQVKIANDGEILVKGENVMLGYWNNEKETKEIIKNGWLHTGDIGEIDEKGFLKITDRKKDIIVNHGGDNISPSKIENFICTHAKIKQCLVYGDKKNYLVALVVVEKNDDDYTTIRSIIDELNKNFSVIEKIKKFKLITDDFTIENGLMTPTLKLKRKKIVEKYKQDLENLYSH